MSRHYTTAQKALALDALWRNQGNILVTALQLNIPQRTLRDWRQQALRHPHPLPPFSPSPAAVENDFFPRLPPPPPSAPPPPFSPSPAAAPPTTGDLAALEAIRRQIMDELIALASDLHGSFGFTTPYQRLQLITQLINHIIRLDQHLQPYRPQPAIALRVTASQGEEPDGG